NDERVLDLLCERFPLVFARDPSGRVPLKRGIDRELVARLNGAVSRSALKRMLGAYTADAGYRAKLIQGAARLDLDRNAADAVTTSEAEYALAPPRVAKPTPSPPPAPPKPKRLSLDDLRRAARQRKGLA